MPAKPAKPAPRLRKTQARRALQKHGAVNIGSDAIPAAVERYDAILDEVARAVGRVTRLRGVNNATKRWHDVTLLDCKHGAQDLGVEIYV